MLVHTKTNLHQYVCMRTWLRENEIEEFTVAEVPENEEVFISALDEWDFENENDALMFLLVWGKFKV